MTYQEQLTHASLLKVFNHCISEDVLSTKPKQLHPCRKTTYQCFYSQIQSRSLYLLVLVKVCVQAMTELP